MTSIKILVLIGFLFIIPACAEETMDSNDDALNVPSTTTPTCQTYVEWTGKNIKDIDLSVLGDRPYRIIEPDGIITMDYLPDRLNINITDDGIILTQECG